MKKLEDLRQSIDNIDSAFIFLLAERTRIIVKVGLIKSQLNLSFDYSSERKLDLQKTLLIAKKNQLSHSFTHQLFEKIYAQAISLMESTNTTVNDLPSKLDLNYCRESIYNLDVAICHILAERFRIVRQVANLKKQLHLKPLAANRWQYILDKQSQTASTLGVNQEFIVDIMNLIHTESLRIESI